MIGLFFRYLEFRMHPRRSGSYANAYYAAKRAARSYRRGGGGGNNNGGGDGCGGCLIQIILFCFSWFFSCWALLFLDVESDLVSTLSTPLGVLVYVGLNKLIKEPVVSQSEPIPIEDEVTNREFYQKYEFRKYNPVHYSYVIGISTGGKTYRFTKEDIKSFWVDFDSSDSQVFLHILQNTFTFSKTPDSQQDIDYFISFVMRCGGLDTKGKIPTEPPDRK